MFYYLDFIYYRDNNTSITGDTYISKKFGPVPKSLQTYIQKAKEANLIEEKKTLLLQKMAVKRTKLLLSQY